MPNKAVLMMSRRLLLTGASALTVAGCGDLLGLGPGELPQLYTFKPVMPAPTPGVPVSWALAVAIPNAGADLDSTRLALTRGTDTMDYYAKAAWPDRLPLLVQSALVAAFQDSGRVPAVAREQDALRADYLLTTDIRDFTAHYADPDGAPTITVTIVAQMASAHGRKVQASLTASQSAPASANSVAAAAEAYDAAFGAVLSQILNWALALPPPPPAPLP